MAKVTYKALSPDDPQDTSMGGYEFKGGKAVEVKDEELLTNLKQNPFFSVAGEKAADSAKDDRVAPESITTISQANNPAYPPGVGEKTQPPSVTISEGTFEPGEGTRKAEEAAAETAEKRGPGRPAK